MVIWYNFCVFVVMKTYIYTLTDPTNNKVRYVGKTTNVKRRYYSHINKKSNQRLGNFYLRNWLLSLLNNGQKPILEVIDECDSNWEDLEKYWIAQFKQWGFKLANLTEGGEGTCGYTQTVKHKEKISQANKALKRKLSLEHKKIISNRWRNNQFAKGAVRTEEAKENLRILNSKPILQYDKFENFIQEFSSIKEASNKTNIKRTAIMNNLKNRSKTAGGYIWKYKKY